MSNSPEPVFSTLVVDRWFGGRDHFLQLAGPSDHNRLAELARLTRALETAVLNSGPGTLLYMRQGSTPLQLFPRDSLPAEIYRELVAELA